MAYFHSPRIPTDGLSLCLDASNSKSYSGSGSIWRDIAGGRNFISTGTQTPFEIVNGVKSFSFNGSGYWYSNDNTDGVDMGGDCTLLMWIYSAGITERDTIFEKAGTIAQSYQQEIAVTWEVSNNWTWYSRLSPNYDTASTTTLTLNNWCLMGIRMSTGRTSAPRVGYYSKNGGNWVQSYTSRSDTALVTAGQIRIGSGYAGQVEAGSIGMVVSYNKQLSNDEVNTFYNATKSRFGL
jgi:hypothetical protein